jgi:hypothetical protein
MTGQDGVTMNWGILAQRLPDILVLKFVEKHGSIKRADVMDLCRITKDQAAKLLKRLTSEAKITKHGERRGTYYERKA